MQGNYFFGYGSLVNRATHGFREARPATARGWRRMWRHTALRNIAILTAIPDPATRIEGLVASVPNADFAALDLREAAYDRVLASLDILHDLPAEPAPSIALYTIPDTKHPAAERPCFILLSYLDVVVQGYLREFGEPGVRRFFDTTDGWDAPIRDDRADPQYSRHQPLTDSERALVDAELSRVAPN